MVAAAETVLSTALPGRSFVEVSMPIHKMLHIFEGRIDEGCMWFAAPDFFRWQRAQNQDFFENNVI